MKLTLVLAAALLVACPLVAPAFTASAQQAEPKNDAASLEKRANEAYDKGDFTTALQIYTVLVKEIQNQPDKLKTVQERITLCQNKVAPMLLKQQAGQPQVATSPEQRKPHVRPKDGAVYEVTIQQLGNFEYDAEKGGNLPEDVKKLDGVKVKTRGYMIPLDQADNISEFALVADLFACCFGQPPQVQHTLVVHAPKGKAVTYYPDEIYVEGELKVSEKKEDGIIISVFEINCTSVKPTPK
jgi:hypothetical protein